VLRPSSSSIFKKTWIPAQKRCRNDETGHEPSSQVSRNLWDATLEKVEANLAKPSYPVPTPKLEQAKEIARRYA
jgi:hypothetical protein